MKMTKNIEGKKTPKICFCTYLTTLSPAGEHYSNNVSSVVRLNPKSIQNHILNIKKFNIFKNVNFVNIFQHF